MAGGREGIFLVLLHHDKGGDDDGVSGRLVPVSRCVLGSGRKGGLASFFPLSVQCCKGVVGF